MFTCFFRDPNDGMLPRWPNYEKESREHMNLDTNENLKSGKDWNAQRCHFWNKVIRPLKNTLGELLFTMNLSFC